MTDSFSYDTTVVFCPPGSPPGCSTTVTVTIDSLLTMFISLSDGRHAIPPQPWGLSVIYQFDAPSDSFVVSRHFLLYATASVIAIFDPEQYRSVTLIASPASYQYQAYNSTQYDFSLGYFVSELLDSARIDSPKVNILATNFVPYPNPAVVADMGGSPLKFKFEFLTEESSNYGAEAVFMVDIFNIAGEFVRGFDVTAIPKQEVKKFRFITSWDMKNEQGTEVASGVYFAVGRLYSNMKKGELLAEDRVKVAIIR